MITHWPIAVANFEDWSTVMMRYSWKVATSVTCVALLLGCASTGTVSRPADRPSPGATSEAPKAGLGELTRAVWAIFETDDAGKYEIFVSADYDIPLHRVGVTAQGEFHTGEEELYYRASASEDAAHVGQTIEVDIDDALTSGAVRVRLRIASCTDEDGRAVTDTRCTVGQTVDVDMRWGSAGEMENLGSPNANGEYPGRGRLCSASGKIGDERYTSSRYALIVESLTYQ